MAKVEITISNQAKGRLILHEKFEISPEVACQLIAQLEAMVAHLPGRHRLTRRCWPGTTLVEVTLNAEPAPPAIKPSFEALFRQERETGLSRSGRPAAAAHFVNRDPQEDQKNG